MAGEKRVVKSVQGHGFEASRTGSTMFYEHTMKPRGFPFRAIKSSPQMLKGPWILDIVGDLATLRFVG